MKAIKIILVSITAIVMAVIAAGLVFAPPSGPKITGGMSEWTLCNGAGYIIKQKLGEKFDVYSPPCSAMNTTANNVEIEGGYISPLGLTLYYTAKGYAPKKGTLHLTEIKVHGVDDDFIPFRDFQ